MFFDISEIIKGKLYVSGLFYSIIDLKKLGIKTIINVSNYDYKGYDDIKYYFIPFDDSYEEKNMLKVAKMSYDIIKKAKGPVLVHCYAGMSRSISVVIYYLMKEYNVSYDCAYKFVKKKRSIAKPNKLFALQLSIIKTNKVYGNIK